MAAAVLGTSFLCHVLLLLLAACRVPDALAGNPRASPHPKVLMVSYDGFRYTYHEEHGPGPTFNSLIESGVYVPELMNVFPTKTFPNHISLVTGLYPGDHAGLSNSIYDRDKQEVVDMFRGGEDYVTRNPGVLPLWVVNEMAGEGRYSGVSMWPGEPFGFGPDKAHAKHGLAYNPSMPWEERVDVALSWFVNESAPANFVAFYIEEPDKSGHDFGPDSPEVGEVVHKLDNLTLYIKTGLEKLGLWDEVNLILTSDHGMSPVKGTNILNISQYLDMSTVARTSSSPLLFFYALEGHEATVEEQLRNASEQLKFELYKPDEWPSEWNLGSLDTLPDYLAISPVGSAFEEAFWLGDWNNRSHELLYGQHGFDNNYREMHPYMIGHGPNFKRGFKKDDVSSATHADERPMMNLDLYPMVCQLLGVATPPNNGSLARVAPLLLKAVPPGPSDHVANVLLPAIMIFLGMSICAVIGFVIWRRRRGSLLENAGSSSGRIEQSDRVGARSEEEQHLLVPPPFLTATEEV